ncbi:hypothetical protein J437_LFUL008815 [Ladona fulva]|uniref:YEATS domain-containing protein n=1 Tax=Ladona fulva TaxID=123851 RepID=A0A8K0KDD5_LADFU|nr:hypothetical protein J437_LFUL008815 [Ladona fulva]
MAYSCVEVWFEIGHEASVRTKRTPEGFTHDWEVFVRGVDNADIHYFVEKVVFYLHETFPKPKRVVKEPPYSIKESGYAGFNLPIEVYFKNKDEPKKVQYNYDLQLQPSGPPISKIKREKYTFSNPSEDFRRKLIRGGGVGVLGSEAVGNSVSSEKNSSEEGIPSVQPSVKHSSLSVAGKPKLSSESTKKAKVKDAKIEDIKPSNSFADLFGPPIKTAKVSPDPKKPQSKVSPVSKESKALDKSDNTDKHYSGIKTKHIPQKEIKKENASKDGEKKDKNKDRERSKDKNSSSSSKHSTSPSKLAKEEARKAQASDHKERVDAKNSDVKSDRKKEKKAKEEKVKKDKHKDVERGVTSERGEKSEKHSKENKEKEVKKSPKAVSKETEKVREKEKHRDSEKDKLRHKHKKKEKEKYKKVKDENKEKAKKTEPKTEEKENGNTTGEHRGEKRKRSESRSLSPSPRPSPVTPNSPEKPPERPQPVVKDKPAKNPLSQLFAELEESFNSDSNSSPLSGDEDVIELPKPKEKIFSPPEVKPEPIKEPPRVEEKVKEPETPEISVENTKSSKQKQSSHREKSSQSSTGSKSKSKEKSSRKKERDSGEITSEDTTEKKRKKRSKKGKETEDENEERRKESGETADSVGRQAVDNSSNYKHKFSKEYLSELLDLQKKIMTINDGEELQKVVHVLAQSGKYEINSKTFDVDLCALDKSTVKKLQEFFSAS